MSSFPGYCLLEVSTFFAPSSVVVDTCLDLIQKGWRLAITQKCWDVIDSKKKEPEFKKIQEFLIKTEEIKLLKDERFRAVNSDWERLLRILPEALETKKAIRVFTNKKTFAESIKDLSSKNGDLIEAWKIESMGSRLWQHKKMNSASTFEIATEVEIGIDKMIAGPLIPCESAHVFDRNGKKFLLKKKISAGGEGAIYELDGEAFIAKIYKKEQLSELRRRKVFRMVNAKLKIKNICFPQEILVNEQGEFVGFLMEKAEGDTLSRSIFHPMLIREKFPTWTRKELVRLCLTILKKIRKIHERGIIIGDINENNIIVQSEYEVSFVDTDSFQVEGLPSPGGVIKYCSPEILRRGAKAFSSFLRTREDDLFALAVLLFRILLPGKSPWAQCGDGANDDAQNIMNLNFPYALGEHRAKNPPKGPWVFAWSHLLYKVKHAFYHTFSSGGEYSQPESRLGVDDWIRLLTEYFHFLEKGTYLKQDPMSNDIFPNRLKKQRDVEYGKCILCGKEERQDFLEKKQGYCANCFYDEVSVPCSYCGVEFQVSRKDSLQEISGEKFLLCPKCREKRNDAVQDRKCYNCGAGFSITLGEEVYFKKKGLILPTRCPSCRKRC